MNEKKGKPESYSPIRDIIAHYNKRYKCLEVWDRKYERIAKI